MLRMGPFGLGDLNNVEQWANKWAFKISITKTKLFVFLEDIQKYHFSRMAKRLSKLKWLGFLESS